MDKQKRVVFQSDQGLDLIECLNFVQSVKCGAINIFSGTIRDQDVEEKLDGRVSMLQINAIHYEAYKPMARKQISKIIDECHLACLAGGRDDGNTRVSVALRFGLVPVGESAILICASSTRRAHSHQLVLAILQRIKAEVVIWKKIVFVNGKEQWASECKSEATWLTGTTNNQND